MALTSTAAGFGSVPFKRFLGVCAEVAYSSLPPVTVRNIADDGPYIEWRCEKTIKPDADRCEIAIHNLHVLDRATLQAFATKHPGLPLLDFPVRISIGWDGQTALLFSGKVRHFDADRNAKGADRTRIVTWCRALDGVQLKDRPPGLGNFAKMTVTLIVGKLVAQAGLRISPASLALIGKAAAKLPHSSFRSLASVSIDDALRQWTATLGLSYAVQEQTVVILDRGINPEALLVRLGPDSGLLTYKVRNNGTVLISALAVPVVLPGGPIQLLDSKGAVVTGGDLRVEKVTFKGSTDRDSTMEIVARTPTGEFVVPGGGLEDAGTLAAEAAAEARLRGGG